MAFFKSTWFKCVSVLLSIALVAGGLLAVLNDVLFVTAEERTTRAMSKIYDKAVDIDTIYLDVDATKTENSEVITEAIKLDYGTINKIYIIGKHETGNFDIVYQTTGSHGYKGGSITLWIKVEVQNGDIQNGKIDKIVLESYDKQTLMSKFDSAYYQKFVDLFDKDKMFTVDKNNKTDVKNVVTGATKSSVASCNAVNCVIAHLREFNLGGND